jgi:hypothetical protein
MSRSLFGSSVADTDSPFGIDSSNDFHRTMFVTIAGPGSIYAP